MSEQQRLRRKISAYSFSIWELHLFLDSHPNNCEAAKKMDEYRKKYEELKAQYEASYGPLNENRSKTSRWDWVTNPWPWETEEDDE